MKKCVTMKFIKWDDDGHSHKIHLPSTKHENNIDYVLFINNPDSQNYLGQIYSPEPEIKDTMERNTSASEVLDNHKSVLTSLGIDPNEEELDLTYIYWITKMYKNPYNIDSLPVRQGAPPSLYPFFLQSCLHIFSKFFISTAKQPILEVG